MHNNTPAEFSTVYVVHHSHILDDEREDVKLIGVYSSRESAESAIHRLCNQPGFCDFPKLIDPFVDTEEEGFYIDAYKLDQDNWTEGFVTHYPEPNETVVDKNQHLSTDEHGHKVFKR